ncbi:MAG: hypothetical protein EOO36_15065, partial [Cytophagaceae bacterium]
MASFSAELMVAGHTYLVRLATYEFTQAADLRGRASAKVRHGLLHLTLDVPPDDVLLDWAAQWHKSLPGEVVFFASDQRTVREAVGWEAGQCVGYTEEFAAGDAGAGAYVCQLTITTTGLTLHAGRPSAYVPPAATSAAHHGPAVVHGQGAGQG